MRTATVLAEGATRVGVVEGDDGDERIHLLETRTTLPDLLRSGGLDEASP